MRLAGKVAVITGAASGIGRASALRFAREGAHVRRLDVLFNNAAVQVFGTIPETSTSDWHKVLDVNLKGVYLGCKYAIPR